MCAPRPRVLFVTDLAYVSRGRRYCDEDIFLSSQLREWVDIALCHPLDALALMDGFDAVVVRNSGPVLGYQDAFDAFARRARENGTKVFTQLIGKGDQRGKQYLVDLFADGFPVIPTVDDPRGVSRLPEVNNYVVKPKWGADSIGMRQIGRAELSEVEPGTLIQPRIDFVYEVSFYFIGRTVQYALYAPDPGRRWELEPYSSTAQDEEFAQRFVDWNDIDHGITRVDACHTVDGTLLLVELEDLNPYLSLDRLPETGRRHFVSNMADAIVALCAQP
ncbi:hypothetical protein CH298_00095 [Rhodococcoides fascians]|uniref:hypothetical protein n=1 Tax=Rhodococcoides fascians TaxID=1828 RepID=UPI000B9ACA5C|nr:hypothetical protein [Rhodococcus fascians]OZE94011.1 hypothetical protein CH303_00095 [Rhodococcus fascians]OZF24450.1 hypothetical protein CH298_00095 [Rhodococcus fascians]OZF25359.1 hypothetical protein CH297_00095 [Rhodococcus fascians]OZF73370.1 hypothetical protein CH308_00095 [Rhodococcus fascians]OZF74213.1 hypothetical protein CH307_00095 [Rhodococcus fascians]